MSAQQSQVVCITGMHRSATSLVASWLESSGLVLDDGRILGARVGNPKGHFEDEDFLKLHHAEIEREFPSSGGWLVTRSRPIRPNAEFESAAQKLIAERSSKFPLWGWKDPRTSLFLEHWKRWIPQMKVVLLWRPCEEVVESLLDRARRDGDNDVPTFSAVASWRNYNRAILEFKRRWPSDAVLIAAGALPSKASEAVELIRAKICPALKPRPLGDLLDPSLLKARRGSLFTRFVAGLYATSSLERELEDASDINSGFAPGPSTEVAPA
jgi:hypothetical protein